MRLAMKAISTIPLLLTLILGSLDGAAVSEGENLLLNGEFACEQVEFPEFWSPSSSREATHRATGGPQGKAAIVLKSDGADHTVSARQQGLTLVPGESYKLSAFVKTVGFKSRYAGVVLHNSGWTAANGISNLPTDSDWTYREKVVTLMPSRNNEYGVALFASHPEGEIHFAGVRLEALSEAARQGSRSQAALVAAPRLVPLQPLLHRIPRAQPELSLRLFGMLPEGRAGYECVATAGSGLPGPIAAVGQDGRVRLRLDGLGSGESVLSLTVRHRQTQQAILQTRFPVRLIDVPAVDLRRVRPLNHLVAELLNEPVPGHPEAQPFSFVNPRDGWVFLAFAGGEAAPDLRVCLDGLAEPVITAGTARREAFRELPMGEHFLTVRGNGPAEARLVVRSIPEIFDYPPCASSQVKENGSYGWEFMKRHILPAVTTLNGGALPGEALPEAKALGLKWLANFNVEPLVDPAEVRSRMEKHRGLTAPEYDGLTSDELFFGRTSIDHYTRALWELRNPGNRLVYTWAVGKPSIPSLHTDFLSAACNASQGRGRVLFEAYCHPQATEAGAAAYLDGMIGETMRRFNGLFPNAAAGTGIIFGNFNQIPIISLEHDPAVDFKYFLDMQVHLVANSPDFKGLATTGYWGTYYGDEELARWSFLLMRHYAVEGQKEMLSARYGFRYHPGLLRNGDFAEGLEGWAAAPVAKDSIRAAIVPGYGKASQGRWGAGSAGDTVCVLARQAGGANRLQQTAVGLQPGKAYCLQFVTASFQDVTAKKSRPRRHGIAAELGGAELLPAKSFVHVDRRKPDREEKDKNPGMINLHRMVFRAKSSTQLIAFHDEEAVPGEELMINFVQLKPYLE